MRKQPVNPSPHSLVVPAAEVASRANDVSGCANMAFRSPESTIRLSEHVKDSVHDIAYPRITAGSIHIGESDKAVVGCRVPGKEEVVVTIMA